MRAMGLDLGTHTVKAVELDTSFGRFEIRDYHEKPVAEGETPYEAAASLIASLPKTPDRICVALKTRLVTLRGLHFPTRDKKTILSTLAFELEDELPFPIEDVVYDSHTTSQSTQGSEVHVGATTRTVLNDFISECQNSGIKPHVITTEAWAFRVLLNRLLPHSDEPVLVCMIGHERTVLYVHHRNAPILAREVNWGGRDLTDAISKKLNLPLREAESFKRDQAHFKPQSPDQQDLGKQLRRELGPLIQAIRQAELTAKRITRIRPTRILLSGAGALVPGLDEVLAEQTHSQVEPLKALTSLASGGVDYSEHSDLAFSLALGLALTQVSSEKSSLINFRKGDFAFQGKASTFSLGRNRSLVLGVGAVLGSLFLSSFFQMGYYQSQLNDANKSLEKSVRSFLSAVKGSSPSPSALKTYLSQTQSLQKTIRTEVENEKHISQVLAQNENNPIGFLKTLSQSVPKNIVVDLIQFQVGAAAVTQPYSSTDESPTQLTFLVADEKSAEQLSSLLSSKIGSMQKSASEPITLANGQKRYKITLSGRAW